MKLEIRSFVDACLEEPDRTDGSKFVSEKDGHVSIRIPLQNTGVDNVQDILAVADKWNISDKGKPDDKLCTRRRLLIATLKRHGFTMDKVTSNNLHEIYWIEKRLLQ